MENPQKYIEDWNRGLLIPGLNTLREMTANGDPNILVAVLDTPINGAHETLQKKRINDFSVTSHHGTHIASVIAGESNSATCKYKGIAPSIGIISIPIYAPGKETCNKDTLARGIHKACDAGAHIINISGGQFDRGLITSNQLSDAVNRAVAEHRLIVSAAGNDGREIVHAPAFLPGVLGVGAASWNSKPMPFSNYGSPYKSKTVLAPGHLIPGADNEQQITLKTGTSFATPIVTGVAALLLSYSNQMDLGLDPLTIGDLIIQSSELAHVPEKIPEDRILAGRLNVLKATQMLTRSPSLFSTNSNNPKPIPHNKEEPPMSEELPDIPDTSAPEVNTEVTSSEVHSQSLPTQTDSIEASSVSSGSEPINPTAGTTTMTTNTNNIAPNSITEPRKAEQKIFAMGTIGFDFQIAARQDYFLQRIVSYNSGTLDERFFQYFLESNSWEETELLTWVLKVDGTPVYALRPDGVNLVETYKLLASCLYFQLDRTSRFDISTITTDKQNALLRSAGVDSADKITDIINRTIYREEEIRVRELANLTNLLVDWVAVSGYVIGETRLFNGDIVPTIAIGESGLIPWDKNATISIAARQATEDDKLNAKLNDASSVEQEVEESLSRALDKIYYEFKNNGVSDEERAINYVGTNILSMADIFSDVFALTEQGAGFGTKYEFDSYSVSKSKVQRPTSILMDVILRFFEPGNLDKAYKCYRFTVDVSDINPVIVGGKPKQYFESSTRAVG